MMQTPTNRRKRSDPVLRLLTWCHSAAVIALAAALGILAVAKPKVETFFDRYYGIALRKTWDLELANYIGVMLVISSLLGIIGLILNSRRLRRRDDHIHVTLLISLIISLVGLGFFVRFMMLAH